jgi:hypothetical protein
MSALTIYLTGCLLSYIILRSLMRKKVNKEKRLYTWDSVLTIAIISLFSWFTVICTILIYILNKVENKEPPKFL